LTTEIQEIIDKITEHYQTPIRLGSICEANVYYRLEDLSSDDLDLLAPYIADRVFKVCHPYLPQIIINMPGGYTGLSQYLARELSLDDDPLQVISVDQLSSVSARGSKLKGANTILVTDVVTTARSCIEVHTKATMLGASVLCWASIIDRTFGPGPVPVVAACTGEPVRLLQRSA
jgi:hypothetical protein